jgi:prepilin-type N-terminal cleavage/methylation domain-containing protein
MDKKIKKFPERRNEGFSLIELMVAMFIFVMVMGAMVAVSTSGFKSYIKSRSIKTVSEDVGFAINSITKDVRMGKIEKSSTYADGSRKNKLMLTRNSTQQKVCYVVSGDNLKLSVFEGTTNCSDGTEKVLVDLTGSNMVFDSATVGFRSCPSASTATDPGYYACPSTTELRRGWAQINLNIELPSMETDSIRVQTIVSSRDYGWEEL